MYNHTLLKKKLQKEIVVTYLTVLGYPEVFREDYTCVICPKTGT